MVQRLLTAVAMFSAVLALAACGGESSGAQSEKAQSPTERMTPQPAARPNNVTSAALADRQVYELSGFVSPTGNVACMIDADWARCDIIDRDWSPPPRPADCEFDYGQGISLAPGEPAQFVCAGDTAFGADEVLPYGDSITAGVLRCESAEAGITCRDTQTTHGFSISQQVYQLF
jgi:hypothetical protein